MSLKEPFLVVLGALITLIFALIKDGRDHVKKRRAMAAALLEEVKLIDNLLDLPRNGSAFGAQAASLDLPLHSQLGTFVEYLPAETIADVLRMYSRFRALQPWLSVFQTAVMQGVHIEKEIAELQPFVKIAEKRLEYNAGLRAHLSN